MKLKYKNYLHFDNNIKIQDIREYLKDISNHQYIPFINYKIVKNKWNKTHNYIKDYRIISVSSHKDNYVYQYYNNIINNKYEKYINNNNLSKNICAFRKNIGKSNINFAGEILNYIKEQNNCYVFVADITKFFDNLDHKILKNNLKRVLNTEKLSKETYSMLKSLTKPVFMNIEDIYEILKKEGIYIEINKEELSKYGNKYLWENINKFGKKYNWKKILTKETFKKYKKEYIKPTKEELKNKTIGIVQGTSVSGTLSNIYMIDFDKEISKIIESLNGKYLRYCDDLIIAIPNYNDIDFNNLVIKIEKLVKNIKLEFKSEKIQLLKYENQKVINLNDLSDENNSIQFLGFVLKNNKIIDIRESTKQRNNRKLIKKTNIWKKLKDKTKDKIIKKAIYEETIINGEKGNYKKYTFGNYQTNASNIIGGETLKKLKKKSISLIDKHYNK